MESERLTIRRCKKDDIDALRMICEETSSIPCETEAQRSFLHLVFCDPYVETQTEHCFVAVNDSDEPLGYILCAPDTRAFLRVFCKEYLPKIRRLGAHFAVQALAAQTLHVLFCNSFPAHLHIDLSERARHRGTGSALMSALKEHLASIGIHTLFLSCDSKNENAVRFYLRNGFACAANVFGFKILIAHF